MKADGYPAYTSWTAIERPGGFRRTSQQVYRSLHRPAGATREEILEDYRLLEAGDITAALEYVALQVA